MITFDNFDQYLRDNPMPTKRLNKQRYRTVERKCVYERIDLGDVE